jgi:hypothetical protein
MAETGESWSSVSSSPSLSNSASHCHFIALLVCLARAMVQVESEAVADSGLGGAEASFKGGCIDKGWGCKGRCVLGKNWSEVHVGACGSD